MKQPTFVDKIYSVGEKIEINQGLIKVSCLVAVFLVAVRLKKLKQIWSFTYPHNFSRLDHDTTSNSCSVALLVSALVKLGSGGWLDFPVQVLPLSRHGCHRQQEESKSLQLGGAKVSFHELWYHAILRLCSMYDLLRLIGITNYVQYIIRSVARKHASRLQNPCDIPSYLFTIINP